MSARSAFAQAVHAPVTVDGWSIGAFAGLWARIPTDPQNPGRHNGTAFDASLERRLGGEQDSTGAFRVEAGRGHGDTPQGPGFDYTRVMGGITRVLHGASQPPFLVYLAAGGGAYKVSSAIERTTKPSVYGAVGLDVKPGSGVMSVAVELQIHTIGGRLYAVPMLGAKIHVK
jgi:hypothetical protein